MWHEYFERAHIFGIDIKVWPSLRAAFNSTPRVHLLQQDATATDAAAVLAFANSSMDVIIDDGPHEAAANQRALLSMWPLLKPGGFYFIEDMTTGSAGASSGKFSAADAAYPVGESPLTHNETYPDDATREIFTRWADLFFVEYVIVLDLWSAVASAHSASVRAPLRQHVGRPPRLLRVPRAVTRIRGALDSQRPKP